MGRIQSNVGLITGIPITDTINQLLGVASQPRDLLSSRTQGLQQQQVAVNTLSSRVLSLKFGLDQLKINDPFQSRVITTSNEEALTATIADGGKPPLGTFALRPARKATAQQFVSQRFESLDDIPTTGSFSFGTGGFVDKGIALDELNSGTGVARGEIKITDLAGNSAVIDLSLARTVDDVLDAINNDNSINVTASIDGDSFKLTDKIGGAATLTVQEVGGGSTAADLGLADISTTDQEATGNDVYSLHAGTKLSRLNDGNGVRFSAEGVDDLTISLSVETDPITVDLAGATTLGDVIEKIIAASTDGAEVDPQLRLNARISDDGNGITIEDNRDPAGTITKITSDVGSAATDLGIETDTAAATITGERLVSGLRDTLVASLRGGAGIALGEIDITDRDGANATIDLAGETTLQGIVDTINAATGVEVQASINESRNGITITDTSNGAGNLIIANGSSGSTADDLGITIDDAAASINSGTLGRQSLSESTLLTALNGGEGTTVGDVKITDSNGNIFAFDFNKVGEEPENIGDVIDAINKATSDAQDNEDLDFDKKFNVTARINDSGDGIVLIDNARGDETLVVENVSGTLADDLKLTRTSTTVRIDGTDRQVIDGTSSSTVDLSELGNSSSSITLASLNNGAGIRLGDIKITDTAGNELFLDLNSRVPAITTVDVLVDVINADADSQNVQITASINSAGTGLQITDTAGGSAGNLIVEDINGTAAAELKILSTSSTRTSISGAGLFESKNASQGALKNLATKISDLGEGVTASVFKDGEGFRLQINVDETGAANEILLDGTLSGFNFDELTKANDALLIVGEGATAGSGILVSSSTNNFEDVVEGTSLTTIAASDTPVDITVEASDQEVLDRVQSFVDSYNSLRDNLDDLTDFDEESLSTGLLFGTTEALQVDTALSRLVTDRYSGVGSFSSLQEIGITVNDSGKIELDTSKLKDAFEQDAASLQTLFGAEENGVVDKFNAAIDRLTEDETGLLSRRNDSLQATIDANNERIERFNESLERRRTRLELQFFQLEQVISGLQNSQQALNSIQAIPPLTSTNRLGQ